MIKLMFCAIRIYIFNVRNGYIQSIIVIVVLQVHVCQNVNKITQSIFKKLLCELAVVIIYNV